MICVPNLLQSDSALTILRFLGVACTTNKVVPATDSHAGADHAVPAIFGFGRQSQSDTRGLPA